jgi:hypothetical protein
MKTIDISNKLFSEKTVIKVAEDKEFKVFTGFKILLGVTALFDDEKELTGTEALERMLSAIGMLMGPEAKAYCEELDLPAIKTVFSAAIAAVQGVAVEEIESRFHAAEEEK